MSPGPSVTLLYYPLNTRHLHVVPSVCPNKDVKGGGSSVYIVSTTEYCSTGKEEKREVQHWAHGRLNHTHKSQCHVDISNSHTRGPPPHEPHALVLNHSCTHERQSGEVHWVCEKTRGHRIRWSVCGCVHGDGGHDSPRPSASADCPRLAQGRGARGQRS